MGEKGDGKGGGNGGGGNGGGSSSSSSAAAGGGGGGGGSGGGGGAGEKKKEPKDPTGANIFKSSGQGIDPRPITPKEQSLMRDLLHKKYAPDQADVAWKESQQMDSAAYRELLAGLEREVGM